MYLFLFLDATGTKKHSDTQKERGVKLWNEKEDSCPQDKITQHTHTHTHTHRKTRQTLHLCGEMGKQR